MKLGDGRQTPDLMNNKKTYLGFDISSYASL